MNDVLAKPFTRDGMLRILKKHLTRMLKDQAQGPIGLGADDAAQAVGGPGPGPPGGPHHQHQNAGYGQPPPGMTMGGSDPRVKFEQTPMPSPTTTASWHSPSAMQQPHTQQQQQQHHASPSLDQNGGGGGGYLNAVGSGPGGMVLTPGGTQRPPTQQQYAGYMQAQAAGPPPPNLRMPESIGGGIGGDDRPEKRQRLYGPGYVQ